MISNLVLGESLEVLIDHRGKTPGKLGSAFVDAGVPVASAILVNNGRLDLSGARFVDDETWRRWMAVPTRAGDVLLTSEAPLGRVGRVETDAPLVLGQRLYGLRGKAGVLDSGYLYYALQTDRVQADLLGRSTGTTVFGIRQSALRHVVIPAPPHDEQQAIAEVLGALDDKIAANDTAARLADEFVRAKYEALAGDPAPLASIAVNVRDQVDPRNIAKETPYVGLEHVPRRSMWLSDFETAAKVSSAKATFRAGDVLFGKLRPYFHKVVDAPFDGVASTDILVVRSKRPELRGLVLAAAASDAAIAATTASSEGTRMPRTKWADLGAVELPWPGEEEARAFSSEVVDLAAWAAAMSKESQALAATRDELLPLLMSGKVRIKDAEKTVEGVL